MSRPILIIKTGEALDPVRPRRGDFELWMADGLGLGVDDVAVASVYRGEALPDPRSVAGVVVTGSPAMVSAREAWSEASADWLAEAVRTDALPVLGICYGHQLIAHGLGGEVGPNPRGREMGTVEVRMAATARDAATPAAAQANPLEPLFEEIAYPVHMSHVESVLEPPADAQVLARTEAEPHAAIRFGPRQWGVQFHPEFDREIMQLYVEARRDVLAAEGLDPEALIATARETPASARVLERFGALVAESEGRDAS